MYSTLIMFAMTYWTWGQFFKWTGLIYAVYYTILISYEVWKSYKKGSNTYGTSRYNREGGDTIYEIPQFDTNGSNNSVDIKPIKVTLLDMQTIADKLIESDNSEKGAHLNMEQNHVREEFQKPEKFNQEIVEEHSLNTTQFVQRHRENIGKALNAFN
jgi:hypothetical protein